MPAIQDKLFGKKIVIIGGTSGIGFGVAQAVHALGAHVVVASSTSSKVTDAVKRLEAAAGGPVEGVQLQGLDEASTTALFNKIGKFDHLVYTAGDAGLLAIGSFLETPIDQLKTAYDVRMWGAIAAIKAAHPHLSAHGSVTLTGGIAAHRPAKDRSVTSSLAGALETLVRGLAVDLAPVRVNLVEPGAILTEVWGSILPAEEQRKVVLASFAEKSLLKRVGDVADAAETYVYLIKGEFTTGTVAVVDGGTLLV
ncbi:hypothetical protein PLICRDRAFT_39233 [Plicaturopsis crispa FD-325 SS-3]|nr:hypothetical protein PLICRDRAFT_39233 [Plicaturopsis crispa FD-325 SS-3]